MYDIIDSINLLEYEGFQIEKIKEIDAREIIQISLEKRSVFPMHASPTDANLIMLEGAVSFFINNEEFRLFKHQLFTFPKDEEHWVEANKSSKFLIIR